MRSLSGIGDSLISSDGVHPLADGYVNMGAVWKGALTPFPEIRGDFFYTKSASVLVQNSNSGSVYTWNSLDGNSTTVIGSEADANWKIGATADFDGNGQSDIAWYSTANLPARVWLMSGSSYATEAVSVMDAGWSIAGAGDMNGDGMPDLIWQSATYTVVWYMNGSILASTAHGPAVSANNAISAVADFNNDGTSDWVLHDTGTGNVTIRLMQADLTYTDVVMGPVSDLTWRIAGAADYNGDRKPDLLWSNSNGLSTVWYMNGTLYVSYSYIASSSNGISVVGPR